MRIAKDMKAKFTFIDFHKTGSTFKMEVRIKEQNRSPYKTSPNNTYIQLNNIQKNEVHP
jgi:hypothetical protein